MEERLGFKLVSFGDEQFFQRDNQYFHHICLEDGVTLKFELIQQIHRKFRIRDAQAVQKVSKQSLLLQNFLYIYIISTAKGILQMALPIWDTWLAEDPVNH